MATHFDPQQCTLHGPTAEQAYFQQPKQGISQLPLEVLRRISAHVATGEQPIEATRNAILIGKVDKCFHAISHEDLHDVVEAGGNSTRREWTDSASQWPRMVHHKESYFGNDITHVSGGGRL
jgi:hypothetical protein